ncbi:hypothetical protein TomTYG75_27810 [Sphingobium sp. TomTYG75]
MPVSINPEWQNMAMYAVVGAILLTLLFNIPYVGRLLRPLFSFALLAFCLFLLIQQAPFDPRLARITSRLGIMASRGEGKRFMCAFRLMGISGRGRRSTGSSEGC